MVQEGKSHNYTISIAKGIGIVLMVVGHSGCPEMLQRFIYMFHMPLFFFISGYLFKEKYIENKKQFIIRRIKSLYWPFVKYSLLFLIFHNLFAYCHFYEHSYSASEIIQNAIKYITLRGSEQLLGGYWFLKELLLASIIGLFLLFFIHRFIETLRGCSHKTIVIQWLFGRFTEVGGRLLTVSIFPAVFVVMAFLIGHYTINIPAISSTTMLAVAFFLAGHIYSKMRIRINTIWGICLFAIIVCFTICTDCGYSMSTSNWELFPYFVIALFGSIGVLGISGGIRQGFLSSFLQYAGEKTMTLLTFHFLVFKLVGVVKVLCYGYNWSMLTEFPVIKQDNAYYWIVYSTLGVIIPLFCCRVSDRIVTRCKK